MAADVAPHASLTASNAARDPNRYESTLGKSGTVSETWRESAAPTTVISGTIPPPLRLVANLEQQRFAELADQWVAETAMLSSLQRKVLHRAYQQIIGMGEKAIPMILARLRDEGGYWFWALTAITGDELASDEIGYDNAREAWLRWGMEAGYLP